MYQKKQGQLFNILPGILINQTALKMFGQFFGKN
jgi:hypothetical protein